MAIVTLASGGLDSTTMAVLIREQNIRQEPLFIDYGQRNVEREREACIRNFHQHDLPAPTIVDVSGYGKLLPCGLTDASKDIYKEAFLPCRNLMFLTIGAAFAYERNAECIAIGLLDDAFSIFPDQTRNFLRDAESLLSRTIDREIRVLSPLMAFSKRDVLELAKSRNIAGTYSCHAGEESPCGKCIACQEFVGLEE